MNRSHTAFLDLIRRIAQDTLDAYHAENFSPRRAARLLCELVDCAKDFAAGQSRTRTTGAEGAADAALATEAAAARTLAQLASPLMPAFAACLWAALGENGPVRWDGVRPPASGRLIATRRPFFQTLPGDIEYTVMTAAGSLTGS